MTQSAPATRSYRSVNPATGELIADRAFATDAELAAALDAAHAAYLAWREVPAAERAATAGRMAELLLANAEELAHLSTLEMGKPFGHSMGEVHAGAAMFAYYAQNGVAQLEDEVVEVPGFARTVTRREAVGITLAIEPYNAPIYQALRATAPNVMLGNAVVLKPAEITAGTTQLLDRLFTEVGYPAGLYQTALLTVDQVSKAISDPRVRAVTLTGSERAGVAVGTQAIGQIKPVVLELGGSDAFIVLDSADPAQAAGMAAACRLFIGGQVCASPKRLIVEAGVADAFTDAFVAAFGAQVIGDPLDPETTVGPMASEAAAVSLQELYDDAVAKGATVLLAGGRQGQKAAYFAPAVLTGVTPVMRVYHEEAFGPLAVIYRVTDADAAVAVANDTRFGLGGTVLGDPTVAQKVAEGLDTGMVGINGFLGAAIEIPFGGTKASGVGRELGRTGMDQFANIKTYALT